MCVRRLRCAHSTSEISQLLLLLLLLLLIGAPNTYLWVFVLPLKTILSASTDRIAYVYLEHMRHQTFHFMHNLIGAKNIAFCIRMVFRFISDGRFAFNTSTCVCEHFIDVIAVRGSSLCWRSMPPCVSRHPEAH